MKGLIGLAIVMGCMGVLVADTSLPFQTGEVFGKARRFGGELGLVATAMTIDGGRLYVGGRGFLSVYDVATDPLAPKLLGTTTEIANVRQIAVQEGWAYTVAREQGVWVVDCRDGVPKVTGHLSSTSNCTGIDVAGDVCFVGGSRSGIDVIDVSDKAHPQLAASRPDNPVESQSVAYRNGYLYSGEWGPKQVTVWDMRDVRKIRRVTTAKLESNGDGIWPQGRWLYACTGWSTEDKKPEAKPRPGEMGLSVFDIADPEAPRQVGRVDFEWCKGSGIDMWIPRAGGNIVFCAQNLSGLYAVDVSDKAHPKVLDRWVFSTAKGAVRAKCRAAGQPSRIVASVAVGDGAVYVAGPGGLGAWVIPAKGAVYEPVMRGTPPINISDVRPTIPPAPKGCLRWLPADKSLVAHVTGAAVKGDLCFAAAGMAGLYMLRLSDEAIIEVRRIPLDECMDVAIAGNRLFVAAGRGGFLGYDIGTDGELVPFMRHPSVGARDVYAYEDGTKWVTFNQQLHDISDPSNPKPIINLVNQSRWNKFVCPDLIAGRWAAGNRALGYFSWADLTADPVVEIPIKGHKSYTGGMCALGDKALVVDKGLWTILEPGQTEIAPGAMHEFPKGGVVGSLPRSSGDLVATAGGRAVGVWDFSDHTAPRPVCSYRFACEVEAVAFWKDHVVVPAREGGLVVIK